MGGWLAFIGEFSDLDERLSRFQRIFSVNGVPGLTTERVSGSKGMSILKWAWNRHEIPDVYTVRVRGGGLLLLCGTVTGTGSSGNIRGTVQDRVGEIASLWHEQGQHLIGEINGSFSLMASEPGGGGCDVYTDRFASQSVWIASEDGAWIVGNYPSAIASVQKNRPGIDLAGLWSLLHTGRPVGVHGLFAGVQCLSAAMSARLSPGQSMHVSTWWERRYRPETGVAPREWGERIAQGLRQSSSRYREAMQHPHLFLSGGLDSRIVAAALGSPLKTLTLGSMENAETRIAASVARVLGHEHRVMIRSPYWYLETRDAASLVASGSHLDHHAHFITPIRAVSELEPEAELLLGDLLENFNKHYFRTPKKHEPCASVEGLEEMLPFMIPATVKDSSRWGVHLRTEVRQSCREAYRDALAQAVRRVMAVSDDPADRLDALLRWDNAATTYTYNMITCMRPLSRERNIRFDNDLEALSLAIPARVRGSGQLHRWTLYALCPRLSRLPDANDFLPPAFPRPLKALAKRVRPFLGRLRRGFTARADVNLRTSGSWLLMHEMYRKDDRYSRTISELLKGVGTFFPELLDMNAVHRTWEEFQRGNIALYFEVEALSSLANLLRILRVE